MDVINQPWGGRGHRLGDHIIRLLAQTEPPFEIFRMCVAFVKASGMLRLAPALQAFLERGRRIEVVAGIDGGITSRQGLELVLKYSTLAYVFNNPVATFHPKLYLFERPQTQAIVFVGSGNLTAGGLFTNYEASIGLNLDLTIPADRETYTRLSAIFLNASNLTTGNARRLDAALIDELSRMKAIADERSRAQLAVTTRKERAGKPPLFPRTPVPPAPRIEPQLSGAVPKVKQTGNAETDQQAIIAFHPWETFVMILGPRDTRQKKGFSRDIYIPLAARDFDKEFWGWSSKFKPSGSRTVGKYLERRIDILVRPVKSRMQVVGDVRLYYYDIKSEFRLNCSKLVEGAKPGDLLVIQKLPTGTFLAGQTYEFEATVLSSTHPDYPVFLRECQTEILNSQKKWGYL